MYFGPYTIGRKLENIKEIVKSKLLAKNIEVDDITIDISIDEASDIITEHCNIDTVPEKLKYTLADISVDIIENQYVHKEDENIKSIQQGDTTISFKDQQHKQIKKDEIIKSYTKKLNKFRKLRR